MRIAKDVTVLLFVALWLPDAALAQNFPGSPTFVSQIRRIQYRIVSGRITARTRAYGGTNSTSRKSNEHYEKLTISHVNGTPVVDYDLTTPEVRIEFDVSDVNRVVIKRQPTEKGKAIPLVYDQKPNAAITLSVGSDDQQKTYRAESLWHLWLDQPELCRTTLWPLLKVLRLNWNLAETATAIEDALYHATKSQNRSKREHWATLVADLANDEFSVREAADRRLRESGQVVLPYLRELKPRTLDAEQRFRIRRMIAALSGNETEDKPSVTATWLYGDKQVWFSLLSRAKTVDRRRIALDQLTKLLGQPIEFDPDADEETQARQLAALGRLFDARGK